MANTTDAFVSSIQGSDPQNLMEYITRQKIYNNRFWKEECFGLSAVDVLEKAATSIKCIGGTFGGNQQPTKFLCLVLKLLQLQPESEVILEFIRQDELKYVRALGLFYLRLTGRPVEIHEEFEPLYSDYSKLRYRGFSEWKLMHMDELVHDLLTSSRVCGIALPRLPMRTTLQEEGHLDEGPRETKLHASIQAAGGLDEYLEYLVQSTENEAAIELWNDRHPDRTYKSKKRSKHDATANENEQGSARGGMGDNEAEDEDHNQRFRSRYDGKSSDKSSEKRKTKSKDEKPKKKAKYGTLFKTKKGTENSKSGRASSEGRAKKGEGESNEAEQSVNYWNAQRERLGLGKLK
uniref:Pre-mRNA-splicing factor 38 n=1 Tax=Craspedostauros australis TaxID=1486917 RepID=A0A7R9WX78_9STRA|mmetsp:Transcript_22059/g.61391  ORF Transcript_22059/g.61391 Transcript_22059/m.61391 type:complete len:349 (+) Transcript_22059:76-1122(+)